MGDDLGLFIYQGSMQVFNLGRGLNVKQAKSALDCNSNGYKMAELHKRACGVEPKLAKWTDTERGGWSRLLERRMETQSLPLRHRESQAEVTDPLPLRESVSPEHKSKRIYSAANSLTSDFSGTLADAAARAQW